MNNTTNAAANENTPAAMIPDGTYRSAIGTLDVVDGRATLRASTWSDYEDGSRGTCLVVRMSAAEVMQHGWWRDGVAYGHLAAENNAL